MQITENRLRFFQQEAEMKKALYLFMAIVMICVLAGCNVAPNVPGVTPYASPGTYSSPAAPYGNNLNRGTYNRLPRGTFGNNLTRGATNGVTNGTTNGAVKPGMPGTYGYGNNLNGGKKANTPTSRMNKLMNQRAYVYLNPGDSAMFQGGKR